MMTLLDCQQLDAQDPLAGARSHFHIPAGLVYLDGNSLGAQPKAVAQRVETVIAHEWREGLIRSWNHAGWFQLPQKLGDKVAGLIGAGPGEVVCTDSTSINLFKVLSSALRQIKQDKPGRKCLLTERSNFPTDLYIAQALCREYGLGLKLVESDQVAAALSADVAVLMLTHVNYRTGAMHDMAALTQAAHAVGALTVWDLAHSAGAVPVDLKGVDADFAVGCGYKYLNGGPGAPAFVWVHPRHANRFVQPLSGWWGHAQPFEFEPAYRPAPGIASFLCGTQPILSLAALECGLDVFTALQPLGGITALRSKSLALSDLFIELVSERCAHHPIRVITPLAHAQRGSQLSLTHQASGSTRSSAYSIIQALIARGVIGDFRAGDGQQHPDILRFGLTPLYTTFEDVWHAVAALVQVLDSGEWQRPEFSLVHAVT